MQRFMHTIGSVHLDLSEGIREPFKTQPRGTVAAWCRVPPASFLRPDRRLKVAGGEVGWHGLTTTPGAPLGALEIAVPLG